MYFFQFILHNFPGKDDEPLEQSLYYSLLLLILSGCPTSHQLRAGIAGVPLGGICDPHHRPRLSVVPGGAPSGRDHLCPHITILSQRSPRSEAVREHDQVTVVFPHIIYCSWSDHDSCLWENRWICDKVGHHLVLNENAVALNIPVSHKKIIHYLIPAFSF